MTPTLPAVILVRGGSQRCKNKWALPWPPQADTTLLDHAIRQALRCRYVGLVWVGTDDDDIVAEVDRRFGHNTTEPFAREPSGMTRVDVIKRPRVSAEQSSLEALSWVLRKARIEASYSLLVQCTFPFLEARDLDLLVETWHARRHEGPGLFLGTQMDPDTPAGAAWVVDPFSGYRKAGVSVTTPCHDINLRTEYDAACAEYERIKACSTSA